MVFIIQEELLIIMNHSGGFSLVTDYDDAFKLNGELPKYYTNPNVYDSACMVVATCSYNMKYVPYCQRVLNQGKDDAVARFNELIKAYVDGADYDDSYKLELIY